MLDHKKPGSATATHTYTSQDTKMKETGDPRVPRLWANTIFIHPNSRIFMSWLVIVLCVTQALFFRHTSYKTKGTFVRRCGDAVEWIIFQRDLEKCELSESTAEP